MINTNRRLASAFVGVIIVACRILDAEADCNHIAITVTKGCSHLDNCTSGEKLLVRPENLKVALAEVSPSVAAEYERRCQACAAHRNMSSTPRDCQYVYNQGEINTGVYTIYPKPGLVFQVRCDMDTAPGGWTVFQRRVSDTDFYRTWNEYKNGFGDLENFWLGNEYIWALTNSGNYSLRVDLTAPDGQTAYAHYSNFKIGPESDNYRLHVSGYSGTAGDSLSGSSSGLNGHGGHVFSTKDRDATTSACTSRYHGAWWYNACHVSNLNGDYGNTLYGQGLNWDSWKGYYVSLVKTEMKIRRLS
ncbi:ficolin-2-like [Mya arenaria]|uniref:ficolin-2-like n=1 Tax=Mya arenaria TaxID=6604 RepID=UPI0022E3D7E0|nr:ficolin-2-like [Mya arenaria]